MPDRTKLVRQTGAITAVAALALGYSQAAADTFKPTRFDDPAPNGCHRHNCSLREAILAADHDPNHSTVILGKGTYKIQIPPGSPEEKTGDFDVFRPVTIRGKGPSETSVSGQHLDRVFDLNPGSGTDQPAQTIRGLTIRHGDANSDLGAASAPSSPRRTS